MKIDHNTGEILKLTPDTDVSAPLRGHPYPCGLIRDGRDREHETPRRKSRGQGAQAFKQGGERALGAAGFVQYAS